MDKIDPAIVEKKIEDLLGYLFDNGADRCACDYYRNQIRNLLYEFLEKEDEQ